MSEGVGVSEGTVSTPRPSKKEINVRQDLTLLCPDRVSSKRDSCPLVLISVSYPSNGSVRALPSGETTSRPRPDPTLSGTVGPRAEVDTDE